MGDGEMEGTDTGSAGEGGHVAPMCPAFATPRKHPGMFSSDNTYLYRRVLLQKSVANAVITVHYRKRRVFTGAFLRSLHRKHVR